MDEFPPNDRESRVSKPKEPEEKIIEPIVRSDVIRRKKPLGRRARDMFIGDDTQSVFDHVINDVLIPAFKDMMYDAFTQGMERRIFGVESRPTSRRTSHRPSSFGNTGHISYNRYSSSNRREDSRPVPTRRSRSSHDIDEIIIPSRVEAEEVVDELFDRLKAYDVVSVRELYELCGVEFTHADEKWGWYDLRGACVRRVQGGGYLLDLPKLVAID